MPCVPLTAREAVMPLRRRRRLISNCASLLPAAEGRPSVSLTVPPPRPQSLEVGTLKLLLTTFMVPFDEL